MSKLKANKTSLYKLVAEYVDELPAAVKTRFIKYHRARDYALDWTTEDWDCGHAFFATCLGRPLLAIEIKDSGDGHSISRVTHTLDVAELKRLGMVEG